MALKIFQCSMDFYSRNLRISEASLSVLETSNISGFSRIQNIIIQYCFQDDCIGCLFTYASKYKDCNYKTKQESLIFLKKNEFTELPVG